MRCVEQKAEDRVWSWWERFAQTTATSLRASTRYGLIDLKLLVISWTKNACGTWEIRDKKKKVKKEKDWIGPCLAIEYKISHSIRHVLQLFFITISQVPDTTDSERWTRTGLLYPIQAV